MRHMERLFTAMHERGATVFEPYAEAQERFVARMQQRLQDSVFSLGSCASSNSYYFNQHGEATLLRATSTIGSWREAGSFPIEDYAYA
jgi:hypothetical protein